MKPILVLQHLDWDGPSYLATWLGERGLKMDRRCTESGQAYPSSLAGHAALAILGGSMSANDPLPSLRQAEALVREAIAQGIPVIGHCLGGQLIARALGAAITRSPRPEVGWHRVDWATASAGWFGAEVLGPAAPEVFHWHGDAFALPPGAQPLGRSAACPVQAFAIGPHLAMQFHVELDADKLEAWLAEPGDGYDAASRADPLQLQPVDSMRERAVERLAAQQRLAAAAYTRWISAAQR
jgi:GMP synthase-like glutamine amidotransferase